MKQFFKTGLLLAALGWGLTGCIEPLNIEIKDQAQLLVVQGMITDQEGPYEVTLSQSTPTTGNAFAPVAGADIRIEEEGGPSEQLAMGEAGKYFTSSTGIRGTIDKNYRLAITLNSGKSYASSWMRLKRSPPIDSLYSRYEEQPTLDATLKGMQIYLDTRDLENKTQFYRWKWIETWRYTVPLASGMEYLGNNEVRFIPPKQTCWNTANSNAIRIASSVGNSEDVISAFPLWFVTSQTNRLQWRYSMLVQQFALDEDEYLFWKSLKESNEAVGSLFDRQPQSTTGNITNTNDPDEPVLGYFSASAVSEKRLYISSQELPLNVRAEAAFTRNCYDELDTISAGIGADEEVFRQINDFDKVFWNFEGLIFITGYILTTPMCSDCTVRGGTLEKPDFWVE